VAKLQEKFGEWQEALERKGLKVNADKMETMVCARTAESLQITDKNGKALKQVENFKYLGSVMPKEEMRKTSQLELLQHRKNGKSYQGCYVIEGCPFLLKGKYTEQW